MSAKQNTRVRCRRLACQRWPLERFFHMDLARGRSFGWALSRNRLKSPHVRRFDASSSGREIRQITARLLGVGSWPASMPHWPIYGHPARMALRSAGPWRFNRRAGCPALSRKRFYSYFAANCYPMNRLFLLHHHGDEPLPVPNYVPTYWFNGSQSDGLTTSPVPNPREPSERQFGAGTKPSP